MACQVMTCGGLMLYEVSSNDVWGHGFVLSAKMREKMLATLQKPSQDPQKPKNGTKKYKKRQKSVAFSFVNGGGFRKFAG